MGRHRGTPMGRRRPLRDPQHHRFLRPLHRQHQRGVRPRRPGRPRRAARRSRRQPHDPDQAGLPGRAPDGRERALLPDRGRRVAGDPVAGVPEQPEGVRAVRGGGGRGVHVPGGRGRHRRLLRAERLAARRRRALRCAAAAGEDVRPGAEARALGVPGSDAPDRAAAAAAAAGAGETGERQSSETDNPQDVVATVTCQDANQGCSCMYPAFQLVYESRHLVYLKCLIHLCRDSSRIQHDLNISDCSFCASERWLKLEMRADMGRTLPPAGDSTAESPVDIG
ncbi:hypothetical protein SETIT_3G162900v2 [Setaria italica]|uniref:Uncharacterized protein n=1 Tax=Setaria italica TaxID=4555 RepID=A0A368QFM3_SETIT|nr:hypothetical protein SETIT_3G162900v2 [Setaria italica]RCV16749.1 hypothetical protein SETIT_3G162900v2 [Setaria italica]